MKINYNELKNKVFNYPTKYKYGFIKEELENLFQEYPEINMDKVNKAFFGNTCMVIDNNVITNHIDVLTALKCSLENRDINPSEFD